VNFEGCVRAASREEDDAMKTLMVMGASLLVALMSVTAPAEAKRDGKFFGGVGGAKVFRSPGVRNFGGVRSRSFNRGVVRNFSPKVFGGSKFKQHYSHNFHKHHRRHGRRFFAYAPYFYAPYAYGAYAYSSDDCDYYYWRWQQTGSYYWRDRYYQCTDYDY
jgi:hypothetical protein